MEQMHPGSAQRFQLSRHSASASEEERQRANRGHGTLAPAHPANLVLRAYDAMHLGILVVSREGIIQHYNAAYAQLRHIPSNTMIGRSIAELDRRQSIRAFLETGTPRPERAIEMEMRRNQETLVPIQEGGQFLGCIVLVTPATDRLSSAALGTRRRTLSKRQTAWTAQYSFADIVGHSPTLVQARALGMRAAQVDSPVLLLGESGTGKELFAHAVHTASARQHEPFVPVDCSAISRELLEAELFGYAPGAFTGAMKDGKPGKFELADGGTIFLDEIGEMPMEMQAKLLRVLQERRIVRVGDVAPLQVDFRLIAATNRELDSMVAQQRFRHDLLYRLDVIRIEIPALRERREDIPLLLQHAWQRKSQELGISATLSHEALEVLRRYLWPGNIRELLNMVERLLVSVGKRVIGPQDLPLYVKQGLTESGRETSTSSTFSLRAVVAEAERQTLEKALQHTHGNRNMAAELVGLSRASFYRKLKEYGLTHELRDSELCTNLLQR
jgi:transcriptional regulator with PAS, ATPase and Fis domain